MHGRRKLPKEHFAISASGFLGALLTTKEVCAEGIEAMWYAKFA